MGPEQPVIDFLWVLLAFVIAVGASNFLIFRIAMVLFTTLERERQGRQALQEQLLVMSDRQPEAGDLARRQVAQRAMAEQARAAEARAGDNSRPQPVTRRPVGAGG